MNPLVVLAIGGAAGYLFCREGQAQAATAPPVAPAGGTPPPSKPHISIRPKPTQEVAVTPTRPVEPFAGRWGWPVPRWQGRAPVISDRFRTPRPDHNGVDIMFGRIASDPYPASTPNGTSRFVIPDNWTAVAASDGVLWSAAPTSRGYAIVIDHGPVATYYTHLESLLVPQVQPPSKASRDPILIKAGQPLGVIGADPLDHAGLKHLHFEIWRGGPLNAIDPEPIMKSWEVFSAAQAVAMLPGGLIRNARGRRRKNSEPDLVHVSEYWRSYPGRALPPGR